MKAKIKKGIKAKAKQCKQKRIVVFISHYANGDGDIAAKLKEWIETQYRARHVDVFVSSSEYNGSTTNSIKSGTFAASEIGKNLSSHDVLISLLTPASIKRPWIVFESGAGFGKGSGFIPILCRGLARDSIDNNNPLKEIEGRSASEPKGFDTILQELDKALKGKHTSVGVEELRNALCKHVDQEPIDKCSHDNSAAGGVIVDPNELGGVHVADEDNSLHEYRSNPHPC